MQVWHYRHSMEARAFATINRGIMAFVAMNTFINTSKREFWTEQEMNKTASSYVTDGSLLEGLTPFLEYSTIIAFLVAYTGTSDD